MPEDYDYVFWVGCAGAYDEKARRTTKAVAELLYMADVKFAVLGDGETCTGDPARRAGNELRASLAAAGVGRYLGLVPNPRFSGVAALPPSCCCLRR